MDIFTAAVITVSDTAARDSSFDRSGPLLRSELELASNGQIRVDRQYVASDDTNVISAVVLACCDEQRVDLVITSGGTGFSPRDNTPEAIAPLIDRPTPALTHALTAHSLGKTPLASLSRGISGIRTRSTGNTLIICLPGSPKAVKECIEVLLPAETPVLLHALKLMANKDVSQTHKSMQGYLARPEPSDKAQAVSQGGFMNDKLACSCCRPDHQPAHSTEPLSYMTADPDAGPSGRKRTSPYPMVPLDKALHLIDSHTQCLEEVLELPVDSALAGHILAEDVRASSDLPPVATSNVDGYAVDADKVNMGTFVVLPTSAVSDDIHAPVYRINTGQGLPPSTNAMVMVEDTAILDTQNASKGEESVVSILRLPRRGDHVRAAGSDLKQGQVALTRGAVLSILGGEIGTLAFVGRRYVKTYRKPVVAVLSTGNELVELHAQTPASDDVNNRCLKVIDSNRPGLRAAIEGQGCEFIDLGIVEDDRAKTIAKLKEGMIRADVIVSTGGTSMGESDLLKAILERDLDAKIHFGRVSMKPGKPTTFATVVNKPNAKACSFFALPGNPASALVCFFVFVVPALRKMAGYPPVTAPRLFGRTQDTQAPPNPWCMARVRVKLRQPVKLDPRPEFHRVCISTDSAGQLYASSTGQQRSSGMHSMATANGLLCLPPPSLGQPDQMAVGEQVDAILLGPIQ
ncbi:hypothetical protein K437DRAFT_259526 [Tilletiaria anomala UBC 951]|uniref:MoaB/Mog domain-containing protein n=1 Tax=Tilletiaria anomala (strain ATCC 24038 / CBS 436.72 / UBC 951) TaxID=1037660 RepID=A0A066VCR0_TILAU|nr:uncharacterized protein K437DRAFT_259526 [Tilletiaria anomala UBC 951]KDN38088.1 hypothetical protein K437DRAFT_259526 [Tilletiaria anomala UBC 951]